MTPADQGACVQSLNFPRKVPSLPVRDNQGCLLMPVTQSVQGTWIPAAAPVAERNQQKKKKKTHKTAKAQQHVDCSLLKPDHFVAFY